MAVADVRAWTANGFTREQADFLEARIAARLKEQSTIDRQTLWWILGGNAASGVFVVGILHVGIRDLRMEMSYMRTELHGEMAAVRKDLGGQLFDLAAGQARIEATPGLVTNRLQDSVLPDSLPSLDNETGKAGE